MGRIPGHGRAPRKQVSIMKKKEAKSGADKDKNESQPYHVRLPGFISDTDIGLGEVIKRATYAIGIKPCGGCRRRAAALNRWVVFSGPHSR
jgi:hypothetical protein